jgi:hypothetical protein
MALLSDLVPPGATVALLKVDTEGFERGVFAGAPPELLARVRNVVVEIKTGEARAGLQALLGAAGFTCVQYAEQYAELTPGVAFLDLDLGQPEHTPPGCLSLALLHCALLGLPKEQQALLPLPPQLAAAGACGLPHNKPNIDINTHTLFFSLLPLTWRAP